MQTAVSVRRFATLALLGGVALPLLPSPVLPAQAQPAAELPNDRNLGAATVDVEQCKAWLGTLAGPEFEGRGTGQPGYGKAAAYVAAHFEALGLEARGDNGSYFQTVPWTSIAIAKAEIRLTKGGDTVFTIPRSRLSGSVSGTTDVSGPAVLLNVAVKAAEGQGRRRRIQPIDGLDEVDVEGKLVIVVVRGDGRSMAMARFSIMQGLQGKRAAAVVFAREGAVTGPLRGRGGMSRRGGNPASAAARQRPLDITFGGEDLEKLLGLANLTGEQLADAPLLIPLPVEATVDIQAAKEQAPAMNVWAVLPGSDKQLSSEYIVIGSHLDHLGKRGDAIYPGADDDASGTTGVMAVAQMFAKNGQRPRRSILFVCFSGEERGLVGSSYFAKNCPIPLSSITAELQMDMIGRDEEEAMDGRRKVNIGETAEDNRNVLHLVGTQKLAPALHELCLARNERAGFDIEYDQETMFGRSDHANFARQGVPIAFFFTGLHRDYHKRTDTPDKINYPKLLRVAHYVYDIAFELASQSTRPHIDPTLWKKFRSSGRRRGPEQPAAPLIKEPAIGKQSPGK